MKAQLSVEWMMVLAIILVIAIIAVVSLQPLTPMPDQLSRRMSDQYWGDSPLKIRAFGDGNTLNLSIQNNLKTEIELYEINLSGNIYTTNATNLSVGGKTIISESFNHSEAIPLEVVALYLDKDLNRTETFRGETALFIAVTN